MKAYLATWPSWRSGWGHWHCEGEVTEEERKVFISENRKDQLSCKELFYPTSPPLCPGKCQNSSTPLIAARSHCPLETTSISKNAMFVKECLIHNSGKRVWRGGARKEYIELGRWLRSFSHAHFPAGYWAFIPIQFTDTRHFNIRHAIAHTATTALTSSLVLWPQLWRI